MDIEVTGYRLVNENGKVFNVYTVQTTVSGRTYTVEKRYSDLLLLHRKLKKQINTPAFPPKQIRNRDARVLETRKNALSAYFQGIADSNIYTKEFLEFLDVHHVSSTYNSPLPPAHDFAYGVEVRDQGSIDVFDPGHCPVLEYRGDALFRGESFCKIQDTAVSGVLKALYV